MDLLLAVSSVSQERTGPCRWGEALVSTVWPSGSWDHGLCFGTELLGEITMTLCHAPSTMPLWVLNAHGLNGLRAPNLGATLLVLVGHSSSHPAQGHS